MSKASAVPSLKKPTVIEKPALMKKSFSKVNKSSLMEPPKKVSSHTRAMGNEAQGIAKVQGSALQKKSGKLPPSSGPAGSKLRLGGVKRDANTSSSILTQS